MAVKFNINPMEANMSSFEQAKRAVTTATKSEPNSKEEWARVIRAAEELLKSAGVR